MPAGRSKKSHCTPAAVAGGFANLTARLVSFGNPSADRKIQQTTSLCTFHAINRNVHFVGQRRKGAGLPRARRSQMRD